MEIAAGWISTTARIGECEMDNEWLSPEWPNAYFKYVHDWRRYISADMRAAWNTFTDDQKRMIFENAEAQADAEEWE